MGKKINVKPIETLTIEFEDGETKQAKFSAYAMMILDDEFEGFRKLFESAKDKPFSNGAKLLYAGMKACDEEITPEKAKLIVSKMGIEDILDVFNFAAETFGASDDLKKTEVPPMNRAAKRKAKR